MKKSVTKKLWPVSPCFSACLSAGAGTAEKTRSLQFMIIQAVQKKEYGAEDKTADDLVNQLCDYF